MVVADNPDYKSMSDSELWQLCHKDDMRSYDELFSRYYPRILRFASRYIKDTMQAEELCMDMMFNLWVKRGQLTIKGTFSNYLFRAVRNSVISYFRKELPATLGLEEVKEECQVGRSSDYRLISEEARDVYYAALKKLSPRRRQVFILNRYEHLSYSEIARKLNLSENSVENYMVAALDGLRVNMKEYFPTLLVFLLSFPGLLFLF